MMAITDSEGKVWVDVQLDGETAMRFAINGMDDALFAPESEVEIPDERIVNATRSLARPFGVPVNVQPMVYSNAQLPPSWTGLFDGG